jgi:hypothetical protein
MPRVPIATPPCLRGAEEIRSIVQRTGLLHWEKRVTAGFGARQCAPRASDDTSPVWGKVYFL